MTEPAFVLPLWADLIAVGLGGVQGALFASGFQGQRRLDLLGVAIIGILVGMGGGLIRDILLGVPPASLLSNWYIVTATAAALVGMLLANLFERANAIIVVLDAVAIGLFGAFGTAKALGLGTPLIPAVFIGVAAAVGGSILRDTIMGLPAAVLHVGSLYAVAAGGGCATLAIMYSLGVGPIPSAITGIAVTAIIRLLAVIFDVSLPEQRMIHRRKVAAETGVIRIVNDNS